MKKELESSLIEFKEFCKNIGHDFMVVGSLALEVQDVSFGRTPDDIDVEVIIRNDALQGEVIYEALSKASGNNYYTIPESYPEVGWEHKPYIFRFKEAKFNVWIVKEFTHKIFVYKDYIKYAGVGSVLRAKARLQRKKDLVDFNYLIAELSNMIKNVK